MKNTDDAQRLIARLKNVGLSDPVIRAAWPQWWSDDAEASSSARAELRFSLSRKLGIDPRSLLEDAEQPRFIWRDEARFKHLSGEKELERAGITSFGKAIGSVLIGATSRRTDASLVSPQKLRELILRNQPYIRLLDLLSLCWSLAVPVVHLRVFPLLQKRMAAMTVRVGDRCAVLLGKDSHYPPHIAFYLAHELGHIALRHLTDEQAIVDLEPTEPRLEEEDEEEAAADRFALELLTGEPQPVVIPSTSDCTPLSLARAALDVGAHLGIEPGTLALCFGYSTSDWQTANAAMRFIYEKEMPVWREVNKVARMQLDLTQVPDDAQGYLAAVLGEAIPE